MTGFAEGVPTVEIQLGGKSYTLGWTLGSKRRLKERLAAQGVDLTSITALSDHVPAAVWAGLDADTRAAVTVEEIEEMIHPRNENEILEKLNSLFKESEPEGEPEGNGQPAAVPKPTAGAKKSDSTSSGRLESSISG